jgi:hypothetical protein
VLAASAGSAGAQGIRLSPSVGLYVPIADLGDVQGVSGAVDFGKKESTFAYGLALDFGATGGLGFRVSGAYATSSDVPVRGVGCTTCEARNTVLALTGAVVLRPIPPLALFQPYFLAGAGVKTYDFDGDRLDDDGLDIFVGDQSKFTGQLGAGLALNPRGRIGIFAELSDYISGFDFEGDDSGDLQNDFFFNVGISLGLGGGR